MGTFEFKWTHPASEVYVTGTFDDWSKSEKLVKKGDIFEKTVTLSDASAADKIYYKFVVDGNWVTDHTAPQENDASGNLNNVLTTERVKKHTPATVGIMSGVTPTSTTADLAKGVPLEKHTRSGSSDLPGTFPETPAAVEQDEVSVNPLPAAAGAVNPIKLAPGEKVPDPSSFTSTTLTSGVHDDPELVAADRSKAGADQVVSVSPLPAFPGAVNPIKLAPGEPLPAAGTIAGSDTSAVNPTIQSVGPQSTTAQLAGAVPLESSKVPNIVKESQIEAGASPEASAVPIQIQEKAAVEKELKKEVPVAPATSDSSNDPLSKHGLSAGGMTAAAGGAAVAAGGAAAAALTKSGMKHKLPESVQTSIDQMNIESTEQKTAQDTPKIVKDSIAQSGKSPEAASNEAAVLDKKIVEKELLSEVKPDNSMGESAPGASGSAVLGVPASNIKADSRDVSPMDTSRDGQGSSKVAATAQTTTQSTPVVTTGVAIGTTGTVSQATPATPIKDSAAKTSDSTASDPSKAIESPASNTTADKKKKRHSIFEKIKTKITNKRDK